MARATPSPHIVHNPARFYEALADHEPMKALARSGGMLALVVLPAAITAAQGLLSTQPPLAAPIHPLLLALAVLPPLLSWALRRSLTARHAGEVDLLLGVQGFCLFTFTQLLAWSTLLAHPVLATLILTVVQGLWAHREAHHHYDRPRVRQINLGASIAATLVVFVVGVLPSLPVEAAPTWRPIRFLLLALLGLSLMQLLLWQEGRKAREADLFIDQQARLKQRLTLMQAERQVIQATTALLVPGLQAAQIAHDMASPLSAVLNGLGLLREHLLSEEEDCRLNPGELRRTLTDVDDAARRLRLMLQDLMQGIARDRPLEQRDVEELIGSSVKALQRSLRDRDRPPVEVLQQIEPAKVFITVEHFAALTNILLNGATQGPSDRPVELKARRLGPWFYGLEIRDHGVVGEAQRTAYERVRRILSLKSSQPQGMRSGLTEQSSHRGFGVALTLAKILLVRYNGWLSVRTPDQGGGLLFLMVLPLVNPQEIPPLENHPEEAFDGTTGPISRPRAPRADTLDLSLGG